MNGIDKLKFSRVYTDEGVNTMLAAQKRYNYEPIPEYREYEKQNEKIKVVTVTRKKAIMKFKAILGIMIFFALGMFILLRYSQINEERRNIYKMKAELNDLNKSNTQLQAALNMKVDLEEIEKEAIQKLNMQYPDKNQIVYVNLPQTDFTEIPVQAENQSEDEKGLSSLANQLMSYIY